MDSFLLCGDRAYQVVNFAKTGISSAATVRKCWSALRYLGFVQPEYRRVNVRDRCCFRFHWVDPVAFLRATSRCYAIQEP